jgi:RNA polymerase sigma factor (sigma-70 family)
MQDYRIKVTIRNERLLSAIEAMGCVSVRSFCLKYSEDYQRTTEVVNGKFKPINKDGKLNTRVENLLEILGLSVDEAFTPRQLKGFRNSSFQVKMEETELKQLVDPIRNQEQKHLEADVKHTLDTVLKTRLSPREEKVVRMRFGIGMNTDHTLEECATHFSVTKERIRQIETKAVRRLKHPSALNSIINTGFYDIFTKVDIKPEQINKADVYLKNKKEEEINQNKSR